MKHAARSASACFLWIFVFSSFSGHGQTYSFRYNGANDRYEIQPANEGVYCLFRTDKKKLPTTAFRKVFLSKNLKAIDSIDYSIEGKARLMASYEDEKFVVHTFYATTSPLEKIIFLVTDHHGKTVTSFSKTIVDFSRYFSKPVKKLKHLTLSFVPNSGSPGMLLLQLYQMGNSGIIRANLFSINAEDGQEIWVSNAPQFTQIQTTEQLIIGLVENRQIFWVDKKTGQVVKSVLIDLGQKGYRAISVFATNGTELMLAGSDFESASLKNGKFFMMLFDVSGEKIFDKTDSAQRFSTKRMHLMGGAFDQNGNVVLVAEGWKPDATRAIVATGASILVAAMGGGYPGLYTSVDHKIEQLIFATLSPVDGSLQNYRSFPVGPWLSYGQLTIGGSHILLQVNNEVFMYDVNEPSTPPFLFTSLQANESLELSGSGPIVVSLLKKKYQLRKIN